MLPLNLRGMRAALFTTCVTICCARTGGWRGRRRTFKNWCREPGSNRQAVRRRIFVTLRLSTPRAPAPSGGWRACSCAGLCLRHDGASCTLHTTHHLRRPPSSLYTFQPSFPIFFLHDGGLARRCLDAPAAAHDATARPSGDSPNLRGSAPTVSRRALNRIQVRYVYQFHHPGRTDAILALSRALSRLRITIMLPQHIVFPRRTVEHAREHEQQIR